MKHLTEAYFNAHWTQEHEGENMRKNSVFLFNALLDIAKKFNRKMSTMDFAHKVFSSILHAKMTEEETKQSYAHLLSNLDFFEIQHLRVHFLYYLHQEPKGSAVPGVSFTDIVKKMIELNITNNREFLSKESSLLEKLTSVHIYHERLREIISAFIFGNEVKSEKTHLPSRKELLKQLEACHKKLAMKH